MYALLRSLGRRTQSHPRRVRPTSRFLPSLEALERRDQPSVAITSLYNTGVDNTGNVLADGVADPHYRITAAPAPDAPGAAQVALQNGFPLNAPWVPDGTTSKWIAPHANENDFPNQGGQSEPVGTYTYETTFSLTGLDPATAVINGQFSDDNQLVKVLLNGTDMSISSPGPEDFHAFHAFTITKGFVPGVNKLDFVVQNLPQNVPNNPHNPSGLRLEMTGTADPTATIAVTSATTRDSTDLTVQYNVTGNAGKTPIVLDVYRSNSATLGANGNNQVAVADLRLTGNYVTAGAHTIVIGPGQVYQFLKPAGNGLRPDPTHHFVLVVADQNGALNPADATAPPQANFRIWVVGAVTHGYTLFSSFSGPQTWVDDMAKLLIADQYDYVDAFHWEKQSDLKQPGVTRTQGLKLADEVLAWIKGAIQSGKIGKNDVVDLHFIGHSRGSVVISIAFQALSATTIPQLQRGYNIMTMLDPHPANNAFGFLSNSRLGAFLARQVRSFQAVALDPNVVVPSNVRFADDFWQHTPVTALSGTEGYINLWGESPGAITNRSGRPIKGINLTNKLFKGAGIGHTEVHEYYEFLLTILPLPPELKRF
jgi:hypothetical protein